MFLNWFLRSVLREPEEIEVTLGVGESSTEDVIDEIEDAAEDIDELTETLMAHSILSEERHEQILERVDECLTQVRELSSTTTSAESPILQQVLSEVLSVRSELTSLKSETNQALSDLRARIPNESPTLPTESPESEDVGDLSEVVIEVPEDLAPPPKAERKTRVI